MDLTAMIIATLGAILLGAMSPGPSFVLVVRTAVAVSRRDGLAAALGMGVGGVIFASLALVGLHVILATVPAFYSALKIAGAGYLAYLAYRLWRGAEDAVVITAVSATPRSSLRSSFLLGLGTQLSNPKTAIVYASIFTALLPSDAPAWTAAVVLPATFLIEAGWYAAVALAFSADRARQGYLRWKFWVDRAAGAIMAALAAKLAWEVRV